jgi:pimeloyl-ACP methyl ester carboxylesterase
VPALIPDTVRSLTADLDGPTHYFDFGGDVAGPVVVGVHGLGGAAWNWAALAPLLTDQVRFVALDLAGHGRTPAHGRETTVRANRRLLDRFVREVVGEPVVLVGNSMGGAISLFEASRSPDVVRGLVLVDPALPRPVFSRLDPVVALRFALVMIPGLGEAAISRRRRRLSVEQQVRETLALCCVDADRIPPDVVALGIALAEERTADEFAARDFLAAARSLLRVLSSSHKFTAAARAVTAPVLLVQGAEDRLVPARLARRIVAANPTWQLAIADDVGHVPQLEAPEWTAGVMLQWLAAHSLVPGAPTV